MYSLISCMCWHIAGVFSHFLCVIYSQIIIIMQFILFVKNIINNNIKLLKIEFNKWNLSQDRKI